jgi:hypothetical protein
MSDVATNVNYFIITNLSFPSIAKLESDSFDDGSGLAVVGESCSFTSDSACTILMFFFSFYLTFPFYLHLRDSSTTAPFYWDASPTLPPPASLPIFSSMVPFFIFFHQIPVL